MLLQAINNYVLASREHKEAAKGQYTDKGDVKNYFRASELGSGDRKILYGFFKHQIPTKSKSPKNIRQLANGDYVHNRYQTWWEEMGILISMEERLSSKEDPYLSQYEWEWAGHYDGRLDVNVIRAHAQGLCTLESVLNEATGQYDIEVNIDDAYAEEIGIFKDNYEPITMVADIKTMNPWAFKRVMKGDVSELRGYIDQITFYMYMLNTPYGSLFIEDKGSNDTAEVQVLWHDMHEGVEYNFDPDIHGELMDGVARVVVDTDRFFGSEDGTVEGVVGRVNKLWETKKLLEQSQDPASGINIADVMPPRCSETPDKFPCSWGEGKEKCEFFDHCWNQFTQGLAISAWEACPEELKWEIVDNQGEIHILDSRKVPAGVTMTALQGLVMMDAITLDQFLVDEEVPIGEAIEEAFNADNILDASGELNIGVPAADTQETTNTENEGTAESNAAAEEQQEAGPGNQAAAAGPKPLQGIKSEATITPKATGNIPADVAMEYLNAAHKKAIKCLNCKKENTYERLANGGTKKCAFCGHINKVIKDQH